MCTEGFGESNCSTGLIFCTPTTCMNGGTCTEERGIVISCDCPIGFTGLLCETDLPDCEPTTCDNGGTCVEKYGPATHCICAEGFNGTSCGIDLSFCDVDKCLNGGTCHEGFGRMKTCDCAPGFTGTNCGLDLNFCTSIARVLTVVNALKGMGQKHHTCVLKNSLDLTAQYILLVSLNSMSRISNQCKNVVHFSMVIGTILSNAHTGMHDYILYMCLFAC